VSRAVTVHRGFEEAERVEAARLLWEAFERKLRPALGPEARALTFLAEALDPQNALCARDAAGRLVGLAGFRTAESAFVRGSLPELRAHYGAIGGFGRGLLLAAFERTLPKGQFLVDGIFVRSDARGGGVGTALIEAVCAEAVRRGCREVLLDVTDTNPRARALYERRGFVAVSEARVGPVLRRLFGFSRAVTMVRLLA
jgi:ribosomal protein S18 acetylase RimI-like enzyme